VCVSGSLLKTYIVIQEASLVVVVGMEDLSDCVYLAVVPGAPIRRAGVVVPVRPLAVPWSDPTTEMLSLTPITGGFFLETKGILLNNQ
jgi:hypothetical protein